jgi:hypothetical protein
MNRKILLYHFFIIVGAALLFIPFLGRVHLFDWDEINFAESAREMLVTKDYLTIRIFFEPFWEKPPLFIWMQVLSMKLFGVNEFAARFPNAICGIVTLLVLFNLGRKLYNEKFGLIWTMVYCCSILPFFYFKSGIIDPWFNLFIFVGVYYWILALDSEKKKEMTFIFISAAAIGLGVLTKGPVSILVFGLVAGTLFLINGFHLGISWKNIIIFIAVLFLIGGFWFLLQIAHGNFNVVIDFFVYQVRLFRTKDAGHGGFPLYHFIILLFGMFPASVFAIQGHRYIGKTDLHKLIHIGMITLFWVVLLLFSIVKTKIVHYSSLTYFPLSYLAAYSIYLLFEGKFTFRIWLKILLGVIGSILGMLILLLPIFIANKDYFIENGIITHSFTIGNLRADPGWNYFHSMIGFLFIVCLGILLILLKKRLQFKIYLLFFLSLLFVYFSMIFVLPGAEKISQNAVIEFIKQKSHEDVYLQSFYKSYAVLFYSKQEIPSDKRIYDIEWLTKGDIDKDAYFVLRIDKKEEVMNRYAELEIMYEKNGYVFCKRTACTFKD